MKKVIILIIMVVATSFIYAEQNEDDKILSDLQSKVAKIEFFLARVDIDLISKQELQAIIELNVSFKNTARALEDMIKNVKKDQYYYKALDTVKIISEKADIILDNYVYKYFPQLKDDSK